MERDARSARTEREVNLSLVELSVVLVAGQNDPSIINPDFLRYNGIVDNQTGIANPAISTPVFSQVAFENGLTVTADPTRVIFAHGNPLSEDNCLSPDAAMRYIEIVPHAPYSAIGINPKGFIPASEWKSVRVADILVDKGRWTSFKDVLPDIHLKAIYNFEKRHINLDVGGANMTDGNGSEAPGLLFQANIHRNVTEAEEARRFKTLLSIISAWRDDLSDFRNLVAKFKQEGHTP